MTVKFVHVYNYDYNYNNNNNYHSVESDTHPACGDNGSNNCSQDAICIPLGPESFKCECKNSFIGNGEICVNDPCSDTLPIIPCQENAECSSTWDAQNGASKVCSCKEHYLEGIGNVCLADACGEALTESEISSARVVCVVNGGVGVKSCKEGFVGAYNGDPIADCQGKLKLKSNYFIIQLS